MIRRISDMPFWRAEDGAALVEFGLLLPTLVLVLGLSVEGARTFFGYQTAVSGVRDATRYLSRVVQSDACRTGAITPGQWDEKLTGIVRTAQTGEALFPTGITVQNVSATIACQAGPYRLGAAPVASVTATLYITYPFAGLLALAGIDAEPITTQITDQTRIVGS